MSTSIRILLLSLVFITPFNVGAAKIYKTVDKDGNVVFSDKKTQGAEKIKVQPNVVNVNIPKMPESPAKESPKKGTVNSEARQQEEVQGRGTATGGNLRRKIQNVTNGEGLKGRPAQLPSKRPAPVQPIARPSRPAGGRR